MNQFFKMTFASMLGFIFAYLLMMILGFMILFGVLSASSSDVVHVKNNSVLYVKLDRPVYDRASDNPFDGFDFTSMEGNKALGLNDILNSLDAAAKDDRIKGIYMEFTDLPFGMATVEEIRNAMLEFKESGKFIVVYSEIYSQKAYYLATVADELYVNPEGMIDFKGLNAKVMFLKGLGEKLKVEYQVVRPDNNKFKSAVEPFMLDKMSDANREQTNKWLSSVWDHMKVGIGEEREISVERLDEIADSLTVFKIQNAVENGFVDKLIYKDELIDTLKSKLGVEKDKKISFVTISKYLNAEWPKDATRKGAKDRIAIVYAQGDIVMGASEEGVISSEVISKAIRKARLDKKVKAIVLRVNSPGGNALASEVIWREVKLAVDVKPVIVSMGDYAASGGYYIACPATRIIAQPNTITGSIGVYGVVPNISGLLKEHLGLSFDEVNTNANSGFGDITRPLSDFERTEMTKYVNDFYQQFLTRVSEGRDMSKEDVDAVGQGRVWTGTDALEIGLVDELGGLERAIEIAAEEAGLEKYRIRELPILKDPFVRIMEQLSGEARMESHLQSEMGSMYYYYESLKKVSELQGTQARLPFFVEIQ